MEMAPAVFYDAQVLHGKREEGSAEAAKVGRKSVDLPVFRCFVGCKAPFLTGEGLVMFSQISLQAGMCCHWQACRVLFGVTFNAKDSCNVAWLITHGVHTVISLPRNDVFVCLPLFKHTIHHHLYNTI